MDSEYVYKDGALDVTEAQGTALARISEHLIWKKNRWLGDELYEYKEFRVEQYVGRSQLFVYAVIGMKKDEHTMAAVICRDNHHVMIGKRGGLTLLNPAKFVKKNGETRRVPRKGFLVGSWPALNAATY